MKKRIILIGIVVLVIVLGIILLSNKNSDQKNDVTDEIVNAGDPIDPTSEFYNSWLEAVQSTTTNPTDANLINSDFLSEPVREYIRSAQADTNKILDPVLCQTVTPKRVGVKVSYVLDTNAQLLIIPRGSEEKTSEKAVVDLTIVDGKWQISNISCSNGESGPDREFSFEREGFLLKSVPPPLDPNYWHLVFIENGQNGHTSPLFFSTTSMCTDINGTETVCNETQFKDATKVTVKGEMTEAGVDVKKIIFLIE